MHIRLDQSFYKKNITVGSFIVLGRFEQPREIKFFVVPKSHYKMSTKSVYISQEYRNVFFKVVCINFHLMFLATVFFTHL